MNIKVAREIIRDLQQKVGQAETLSREAMLIALEQLEIALQDDPPQVLQINVADQLDLTGHLS